MLLGLSKTYNEQLQEWCSKSLEDVADFNHKFLGLE